MELRMIRRWAIRLLISVGVFFYLISMPWSAQYINPKEVVGDPKIVRLQQGREKLKEEEISKYGFTGLEIMTYLDYNEDPGRDNDSTQTLHIVTPSGSILYYGWMSRMKYYYQELADLYLHKNIKPGDIWRKKLGVRFEPPDWRKNGFLSIEFLRSKDENNRGERWDYLSNVRRARRSPFYDFEDDWAGACLSHDDREYRLAWEEAHHILGEDTIDNQLCLVVESKHLFKPKYYLSKRITWVTKDNFLDLHEEQFDRKGRLFRVIDSQWQQIKPDNYWARTRRYCVGLDSKVKAFHQLYGWKFDQGLSENIFTPMEMQKEHYWSAINPPPVSVKNLSDLPPEPSIRRAFWNRIGKKPEVAK
jgi:hypothetical protein